MLGNELACWWVFMAGLIASFGVEHNTAGFIVLRYMHISFMPAVGLSMAATAVVGKAIGRRRPDLAERRARVGVAICMAYMGACALVMVVFREPLARVFTDLVPVDAAAADLPRIVEITASLLILAAAFQVFDALAITLVGALRGAGDTIWPGLVTAALSWTLIIGLGYALTRLAPALESFGPWIGAASFIIVLAIALSWRWFSGYWKTIDLLHRDRDRPVPTGAEAADPAAIADELHDPAHDDTPDPPAAAANRPFGPAGVEPPTPPG
jgi:MATE family multidrug resistance protein